MMGMDRIPLNYNVTSRYKFDSLLRVLSNRIQAIQRGFKRLQEKKMEL